MGKTPLFHMSPVRAGSEAFFGYAVEESLFFVFFPKSFWPYPHSPRIAKEGHFAQADAIFEAAR